MTEISEEQMAVIPKPPENKTADIVGALGFMHMVCEGVEGQEPTDACRALVEPLEKGKKDPIEALVDLLMLNPDEMDKASERFNYNMQEAVRIASERVKAKNVEGEEDKG